MQVGGEDIGILVEGAVLDKVDARLLDVVYLLEAGVKEINLEIETPATHVLVEAVDVRIVVRRFEQSLIAVMFGQLLGEGGFPRTDISCYCDMHNLRCFVESIKWLLFACLDDFLQDTQTGVDGAAGLGAQLLTHLFLQLAFHRFHALFL